MQYRRYLLVAAAAGMTVAGATHALAQKADDAAITAAAKAAGITDLDVIRQLTGEVGVRGPEQVGCRPSDEVFGRESIVIDGFRYGGCLARGAENNLDAMRALIKAAQGTGQFRNNAYGFAGGYLISYLVLGDTTAHSRMVGTGKWMGQEADLRLEWDYRIPAVRLTVTRAGGEDIWVTTDPRKPVAGLIGHLEQPELAADGPVEGLQQVTWKEQPAGVYAAPSDVPSEELLAIAYALPTGVVLSGRDAADVMKVSKDDQARDVLTIPVRKLNDAELVATLDVSGRPVHTEITVGGKKYVGDFANFLNDRMDMEQHFPFQGTIQVDGRPLLEWDLDYFHAEPYLIFPVPAEVASR